MSKGTLYICTKCKRNIVLFISVVHPPICTPCGKAMVKKPMEIVKDQIQMKLFF